MKVAVTGAGGFIGSHLYTELLSLGHEVVGLVRPSLDSIETLITKLDGIDVLCHCAWAGHPRSESYVQQNTTTSLLTAKAAEIAGVGHVIFMSTGGGTQDTAYGISKREIELAYKAFSFDLTVLRPTAVYGDGQNPSKGLGAVTTFLSAVMMGEPIHILGSPYSSRDFLHVQDLVECVGLVVKNKILGTFDIAGPEVISLEELVKILESALSIKAKVQIENPTGVDPQTIQLDNSAITKATGGWVPTRRVIDYIEEKAKEKDDRVRNQHV